jgi:20S proteasome subunit beta 7
MNGGSVLALEYDGGVLLAADCLLSYGSLAKQPNVPRIRIVGKTSAVCASGDYADFGEMYGQLSDLIEGSRMEVNTDEPTPKQLFNFMHRTVYHQRNEFEPYMCKFVLVGVSDELNDNGDKVKKNFIGVVDSIGTRWNDSCAAAGMAAYNCLPLMRAAIDRFQAVNKDTTKKLPKEAALAIIQDCCRVIFYRECRAINRFQIADVTGEKVVISEPFIVETNFEFEGFAFDKTAIIKTP